MRNMKLILAGIIIAGLAISILLLGPLFFSGVEEETVSTNDHPDWWKNIGGQNSQDSILERRSLVWNNNEIEDGTVPALFVNPVNYTGKFFTRGCRGMLEQIQLYLIGDGVDEITIRYSPHPCLGPVGEITIVPAAAWAWQAFVIEEMWNYDSLFIWVHAAEANVDLGYDLEEPYDAHQSGDAGATWGDLNLRQFTRAVYTGETPGDVPVSGIINNIPIPSISSAYKTHTVQLPLGVETDVFLIEGAGYNDLILLYVQAAVDSDQTYFRVYCDDVRSWGFTFRNLNTYGFTAATPSISLNQYGLGAACFATLTHKFEFRRSLRITAWNPTGAVLATAWAYPTLMR